MSTWYVYCSVTLKKYRPFHWYQMFMFRWWRHQMETFSALLAICAGNSPVTGEFPAQRPVTRSFDGFFDLRLNKRLSKQRWGWWFETPTSPLWRHCNGYLTVNAHASRSRAITGLRNGVLQVQPWTVTSTNAVWTSCGLSLTTYVNYE